MDRTPQRAAVIIPTYNEAGNIGRLIDEIAAQNIAGWQLTIVIVDGNSNDGTADIVRQKMQTLKSVRFIQEHTKEGIGAAYLKGFACAVNELKADAVIEFDADFQHPPAAIGDLLKKIDEGNDYVLGSRNIPGGGDSSERNVVRATLTKVGGKLARFILFYPGLNFRRVTDPTTGLKATRVAGIMERLNLDPGHLYSKKFGYKIQLLAETLKLGARYAEIPLVFGDRLAGTSKIEFGTAFEILWTCVRVRMG